MKVVWTDQALERLDDIEAYIAQDSPDRAIAWTDKLVAHGERLARFPRSGRRLPEVQSVDLREILVGAYRIVYRLRSTHVEILTVFEGHRLLRPEDLV